MHCMPEMRKLCSQAILLLSHECCSVCLWDLMLSTDLFMPLIIVLSLSLSYKFNCDGTVVVVVWNYRFVHVGEGDPSQGLMMCTEQLRPQLRPHLLPSVCRGTWPFTCQVGIKLFHYTLVVCLMSLLFALSKSGLMRIKPQNCCPELPFSVTQVVCFD